LGLNQTVFLSANKKCFYEAEFKWVWQAAAIKRIANHMRNMA
jgi:hypothetical protein